MPYCGVWKRENNTKVPYNPNTGQRAKSNAPSTFGTRAQVDRALATGKYDGRCYLIHESLGVTAGDLDHVTPEADAFNEAALPPDVRRIIRIANTYTTWSPSGTGIRFFFSAIDPTYKNTNKSSPSRKVCTAEAYHRLRFMTDTGIHITGTPDTFNGDSGDLTAWYEALGFEKREIDTPTPIRPASTYTTGTRTNADILELAFRAKNGDTIRRLYDGDISGYPESQSSPGFSSEADLALVSRLAFYVDDEQLVDLWRSSGLYRPKLDRSDYVQRTIMKARASQSDAYSPGYAARTGAPEPAPAGASCDVLLATARAELAEARQTILVLQERVRLADERESIQRNAKLGTARQTGAVLATLFREERPKEPDKPAGYRMPLAKLAERTGLSTDTCSRQLKQLASYRTADGTPVLHVETRDVPRQVNQQTGEIIEPHREVWAGPIQHHAFGHVLATLAPAEAPKHGGKPDRNVCPEHPDAGVLRRTKTTRKITRECAHCHLVLDVQVIPIGRESTEHIPAGRPTQHDAFGSDTDPRPMPQHAGTIDNHTPHKALSSKMRHSPPPLDDEPPDFWSPCGVAGDDPRTNPGWRTA
jgi:putative DNA primase/helicase